MIKDLLRKAAIGFFALLAVQSVYSFFALESATPLEGGLFFVIIVASTKAVFWLWE